MLNEQLIYWTGRTAATYRTEGPDTTAAEGRAVFSSFIFKLLMPVIKAPGRGGSRVSAKHRINVFFYFMYLFILLWPSGAERTDVRHRRSRAAVTARFNLPLDASHSGCSQMLKTSPRVIKKSNNTCIHRLSL